jgi:cytoskeletal protein RodZ
MIAAEKPTGDFGARLREARERRGLSLRAIADATRISIRALEALERNDISQLPGGIFSRAFVRAYAVEVGLDPEQTIAEFITRFPHETVTQGHPRTRAALAALEAADGGSRARLIGKIVVAAIVIVAAITYMVMTRSAARPSLDSAPSTFVK